MYPTRDEVASEQGVGPHCDGGFLTFVSLSNPRDLPFNLTPFFIA
jgi:hypothetical protein